MLSRNADELMMRVNSPGPCGAACTGGALAAGADGARNTVVASEAKGEGAALCSGGIMGGGAAATGGGIGMGGGGAGAALEGRAPPASSVRRICVSPSLPVAGAAGGGIGG